MSDELTRERWVWVMEYEIFSYWIELHQSVNHTITEINSQELS